MCKIFMFWSYLGTYSPLLVFTQIFNYGMVGILVRDFSDIFLVRNIAYIVFSDFFFHDSKILLELFFAFFF